MTGLQFEADKRAYVSDLNNIAMLNRRSTKTGCSVIQRAPAIMGIRVSAGTIYWERAEVAVVQQDLAISPSDLSFDRIDLIAINSVGVASVITGTPEIEPHTPVYDPELYVIVARIFVQDLAVTVVTADITDLRIINQTILPGVMTYLHTQGGASATWTVTHLLNESNPAIECFDSGGNPIEPESIAIVNPNSLTITFGSAITGKARIVGGTAGTAGGLSYRHAQVVAAATWSVNHALNQKYVSTTVYDGTDAMVIPSSVTLVDANNLTITFGVAVAGVAVILG